MLHKRFESGFTAAFFCLLLGCILMVSMASPTPAAAATGTDTRIATLQAQALQHQLDRSSKWSALLHVSEGEPRIKDGQFILSLAHFSPREELLQTIAYLYGPQSAEAVCRFPARYAWLQAEVGMPVLPLEHCAELQELMTRAPADTLSLVFASENLSQPSSMMGHLFLKTSGHTTDGRKVEHAISFFTDAGTANLPKLFYDSMVTGKKGYFALTPYQDDISTYVVDEQRTLWEYALRLSPQDRTLLRYHLHELRHADITYFFQSYNCATLVKHVLAVAAPEMLNEADWWTTPKFVVRKAQEVNLIADMSVKTPSRWVVRSLQDPLPAPLRTAVQAAVQARQINTLATLTEPGTTPGYMAMELARSYNTYLYEQHEITLDAWQSFDRQVKDIEQARYPGLELQADQSKNPAQAPRDKQVSAGWQHRSGRDLLRLGLLPVSHTLADDNTQYNSENELRLFDSALLIDSRSGRVSLDHLTIYATQSMLPRDPFTGGLSGRLKIGFELQPDTALQERTAFLMEGALGATWRPSSDIDAFVLLGGGWGYRHRGYVYTKPTAGVLIREVYNMKSIITISQTSRPLGESGQTLELGLTQAKYLDAQNTLTLEAQRTRRLGQSANKLTVSLKHLF